ncbi:MAG: YihY/virulence factor BrkB family protein [Spirochaetes bacterium]|jgi:membrane protein|nr:YihY/virulence factor BrkB family protein [Spirochaetota bacterium]
MPVKPSVSGKGSGLKIWMKERAGIIREHLLGIYHGHRVYGKTVDKIVNALKIIAVSTRKFMGDDCLTKASSIAYTVIVSLIPTLTVILTFYSIFTGAEGKKDELFAVISQFMIDHNIKINIDPIFAAISGLIDNAASIGGIGAAVMVFSATAMLRSMEKSFNDIWKVFKSRPILMKIIYYWAALTLGPLMLIAGMTVATTMTEFFSAPNYNSVSATDKIWVVGSKSRIMYWDKNDNRFRKLPSERIDLDNQRVFSYDPARKKYEEQDSRIDKIEFKKKKFYGVQFMGEKGWIVGEDGLILSTGDGGNSWEISKYGSMNLNDIHMVSANRGFIASNSGLILETQNGGRTWNPREFHGINSNFNHIAFRGEKGIITGSRGVALVTYNSGKTWDARTIPEAKRLDKYVNLNSSFFIDENNVWIACDDGLLLKSVDGGTTWQPNKYQDASYYTLFFKDAKNGFAAGGRGMLISTANGGKNWRENEFPTYRINRLAAEGDRIIAAGDNGLIMTSRDGGETWQGREGGSIIAILLNFIAPFAIIWLLFLLSYISLPNTRVPFKNAAIGAAFTGTVWVIFILLFIVYIRSFARGTFAVYGALAAIPLFLLMLYASSVIILYGAEVAYTTMHPETYRSLKKAFEERKDIYIYNGVALLHHVYAKFQAGKGASGMKELSGIVSMPDENRIYIDLFIKKGLIVQKENDEYMPATVPEKVSISEVISSIQRISYDIPDSAKKTELRSSMSKLLASIEKSGTRVIGTMTLRDLM